MKVQCLAGSKCRYSCSHGQWSAFAIHIQGFAAMVNDQHFAVCSELVLCITSTAAPSTAMDTWHA